CLSPKSTRFNEFSSNIATALVCLATNRTYNFSKMNFDGLVKNVNSPSFSGRIVPLFETMLIHQGKGSRTPTEPHHTPSQEAQPSSPTHISSPSIPTVTSVPTIPIPTVIPTESSPLRQYTRRARIAQSSAISLVADEPASPVRDDTPRVPSPAAEEGSMQQSINELTALCTSLQRQHSKLLVQFKAQEVEINKLKARVKILEDNQGVIGARSGDDAPIKGRRIDEDEVVTERLSSHTEEVRLDEGEVAAERTSEDTEEMATVLTTIDASTVLASGAAEVPTGSGSIPTAGTEVPTGSDVVPTASLIFATATVVTPYRRRKGKKVMVESETLKKQKLQEQIDAQVTKELEEQLAREDQKRAEQIARDAEIARIHTEEELQNVEAKFNSVCKQMEDFIPMGSKEEAERIKRKGINLEQESAKKQKSSEEITEEAKSPEEVTEEKIKEMMQLVHIEEVYVEAL
nr:hypothetical protein [Tanacetum cinerariifolium]